MHDGRAKSIEEAIMMHGGEAKQSKDKFNLMNESEKSAIIQFLKSL
ncbi:MAG: di-heme oxidoredictase family protein [Saprospiraceae bacterium]